MTDAHDSNWLQGLFLLQMNWAPRPAVSLAYQMLATNPGCDLCDILVHNRVINEQAALRARQAVQEHLRALAPASGPEPAASLIETVRIDDASKSFDSLPQAQGGLGPGVKVDGYEIVEELARGGMGVVYRARDHRDDRQVALKFILGSEEETGGFEERERFKRELRVLSGLKHPHIARFYSAGSYHGLLYYAMELLEGPSLHQLLRSTPRERRPELLSWPRIVSYMRGIASALAACHAQGVIHRDIKPHNIVIDTRSDRAVLIDFGILKRDRRQLGESTSTAGLTRTGQLIGSPAYMSPEQFGGIEGQVVGPHSDIWSFGVTLFTILAGDCPFSGQDLMRLCQAVVNDPIPRLADRAEVPSWLDELCASCLNRSPYERPEAAALEAEFEQRSRLSRGRPGLFALIALALILAAITAKLALTPDPPPRLLEASAADALVATREVPISGRVSIGGAALTVRRDGEVLERFTAGPDGRFRRRVALREGANNLMVALRGEATGLLLSIACDTRPPEITLAGSAAADRQLILPEGGVLLGQVRDDRPSALSIDGRTVTLKEEGRFRYEVEAKQGEIELIATDEAGNKTSRRVRFIVDQVTQEEWEATRRDWLYSTRTYAFLARLDVRPLLRRSRPRPARRPELGALNDHELWIEAEPARREAIVRRVGERLGRAFELVEIGRSYPPPSGAVLGFSIASFRHRRSGILFQLIPGGPVPVPELSISPDLLRKALRPGASDERSRALFCEYVKCIDDQTLAAGQTILLKETMSPWEFQNRLREDPELIETLRKTLRNLPNSIPPVDSVEERLVAPLLVSRHEVSAGEWAALTERAAPPDPNRPLTYISYDRAVAALAKLPDRLRLPWRAEWIHACLSGLALKDAARLATPERTLSRLQGQPRPLGRDQPPIREANGYGLVDMLGNVEEWCRPDWTRRSAGDRLFPMVLGGDLRILPELCRPRLFYYVPQNEGAPRRGLRLVVDIP